MTPEEHFDIWAPAAPESRWSDWVKPVLFAHLDQVSAMRIAAGYEWPHLLSEVPPPNDGWAAVVDLPGETSMIAGAQFAQAGYRPVPLYNSAPGGPTPLVNSDAVLERLAAFTHVLRGLHLPPDTPPVFLLDSNRRGGEVAPIPGRFDNRSLCFVTDLPSSNFMLAHGVHHVLLVIRGIQPQDDLAHALYRWQEAGIKMFTTAPGDAASPGPCRLNKPSGFRSTLWRWVTLFGMPRHRLGGFGGVIPEPSSGGVG